MTARPRPFGVFVWREDNRYKWSEALDTRCTDRAAQRIADERNARGEHGGMCVVREARYCRP